MTIINELIEKINNGNAAILCGAGISYNSGIPIVGYVNHENDIIEGIETYLLSKLEFNITEIRKFIDNVPFEAFLEVIIDNKLNMELFSQIFNSEPSSFHQFIAKLFFEKKMSIIGTTNFDNCIEKAFEISGVVYEMIDCNDVFEYYAENILIKFHGSIDNIDGLGITIRNIATKSNQKKRRQVVDKFFSQLEKAETIIVFGYSCSDVFDLVPWVSSISSSKNVFYINHKQEVDKIEIVTDETKHPKVRRMFSGFNLKIIDCNTDKIIDLLSEKLDFNTKVDNHPIITWKAILDKCLSEFDSYNLNKIKGNLFYRINEFEKSIKYLEIASTYSRSDDKTIACERSIGWTYFKMGKVKHALKLLSSLMIRYDLFKHPLHQTNIYLNIGTCYGELNKNHLSEEFYLKAFKIADFNKYKREVCFSLCNLGLINNYLGNNIEAIKYLNKSIEVASEIGDLETIGIAHSNLATVYFEMREYEKSTEHIKESIIIATDFGNNDAKVNREMTEIQIQVKSFIENNINRLKNTLKGLEENNNILYKANCLFYIAELYHMNSELDKALYYWKDANELYTKNGIENKLSEKTRMYINQH